MKSITCKCGHRYTVGVQKMILTSYPVRRRERATAPCPACGRRYERTTEAGPSRTIKR